MRTEENIKFLPSTYPKPEGPPVLKRAAAFPRKGSWPRGPDALPYTRHFLLQAGCGLAWPSSSRSSPVLAACAPFTRRPLSPGTAGATPGGLPRPGQLTPDLPSWRPFLSGMLTHTWPGPKASLSRAGGNLPSGKASAKK